MPSSVYAVVRAFISCHRRRAIFRRVSAEGRQLDARQSLAIAHLLIPSPHVTFCQLVSLFDRPRPSRQVICLPGPAHQLPILSYAGGAALANVMLTTRRVLPVDFAHKIGCHGNDHTTCATTSRILCDAL